MKYDDASWHYEGDFPDDLPPTAGATHIGMFLAWALLHELGGELHLEDFADTLEKLQRREISPGAYLIEVCDEKFTDEDLSDDGNEFAATYYSTDGKRGTYYDDYAATLGSDVRSIYHVPDNWESYDRLAPVIQRRFDEWKRAT